MTRDAGEAPSETAESDALTLAAVQARFDAFPWAISVLAGAGAFLAGYLVLAAYVVVGPAALPGSMGEQLRRVGFLFYNAHDILVVAETGPGVTALPIDLLAQATIPLLYRGVVILSLLLASAVVTVYCRPDAPDGIVAIATGMGITLGYLMVALLGTYVFTLTQKGVLYHPQRPTVFLYGVAYPLVVGTIGGVISQTVLLAQEEHSEQ